MHLKGEAEQRERYLKVFGLKIRVHTLYIDFYRDFSIPKQRRRSTNKNIYLISLQQQRKEL